MAANRRTLYTILALVLALTGAVWYANRASTTPTQQPSTSQPTGSTGDGAGGGSSVVVTPITPSVSNPRMVFWVYLDAQGVLGADCYVTSTKGTFGAKADDSGRAVVEYLPGGSMTWRVSIPGTSYEKVGPVDGVNNQVTVHFVSPGTQVLAKTIFNASIKDSTLTVIRGQSSTTMISFYHVSGSSELVSIKATSDLAVTFDPATGIPPFASYMKVTATAGDALGDHNVIVVANNSRHSVTFGVTVKLVDPPPVNQTQPGDPGAQPNGAARIETFWQTLSDPVSAAYSISGTQLAGSTPTTASLPPGIYSVTCSFGGYTKSATFTVYTGVTTNVNVVFTPPSGPLSIVDALSEGSTGPLLILAVAGLFLVMSFKKPKGANRP